MTAPDPPAGLPVPVTAPLPQDPYGFTIPLAAEPPAPRPPPPAAPRRRGGGGWLALTVTLAIVGACCGGGIGIAALAWTAGVEPGVRTVELEGAYLDLWRPWSFNETAKKTTSEQLTATLGQLWNSTSGTAELENPVRHVRPWWTAKGIPGDEGAVAECFRAGCDKVLTVKGHPVTLHHHTAGAGNGFVWYYVDVRIRHKDAGPAQDQGSVRASAQAS